VSSALPASLWEATALGSPALPPLSGNCDVDVAVVGGGYTGLSSALHLAEGGASVALFEAEQIGFGASGRNGGQVNPGLRVGKDDLRRRFGVETGDAMHAIAESAPDRVFELIARLALDCDASRRGVFKVAHTVKAMRSLEATGEALARAGVAVRVLDRAQVASELGTERYVGGLLDPRGGSLHPLRYARSLADAALRAGAQLYERSPVRSLDRTGDAWNLTLTEGYVRARHVIVGTNGYTDALLSGVRETVLPVNSFQIATEPLSAALSARILPGGHTAHDTRRLVLYFRKGPEGRFVLGGRASFSFQPRQKDYSVLARVLVDMFPVLAGIRLDYAWAGRIGITRDFVPHYHVPAPGIHVMLGYNGRGVAMATTMGQLISAHILGREPMRWPVTPIAPIPLHRWREPVLNMAMRYHAVMDRFGR
jgi:sarcosine oxidase